MAEVAAAPGEPEPAGAEGPEAKALSAGEYARRVHQWLWDSYCGYWSWQSSLPALLAAAAAAPYGSPGPPAAGCPPPPPAYYGPCYLLAAPAAPGPRAPPAWPGAARLAAVPRPGPAASSAPRGSGRPAGETGGEGRRAVPGERPRPRGRLGGSWGRSLLTRVRLKRVAPAGSLS